MTTEPDTRYAVVVPTAAVSAALRVLASIRQLLRIDVFEVSDTDEHWQEARVGTLSPTRQTHFEFVRGYAGAGSITKPAR